MKRAIAAALLLHGVVGAAAFLLSRKAPDEPDEPPAMQIELAVAPGVGVQAQPAQPPPQPVEAEPVEAVPEQPEAAAMPPPPVRPVAPQLPPPVAQPPPDPLPELPPVAELPPPPPPQPPPPDPVPDAPPVAELPPPPPPRPAPAARPRPAPPVTRPMLTTPAPRPPSEAPPAFTAALVPDRVAAAAFTPAPPYPPEARARGQQGTVLVRVDIGADGRVTAVALARSSGSETLDRAVLETVRTWRFDPARKNGRPVADAMLQSVRFSLH